MIAQCKMFIEEFRALRWLKNREFAKGYLHLKKRSPYRVMSRWRRKMGFPDVYTYGETPLSTFARIAQKIGLDSTKSFIDLGAGRGMLVLFAQEILGCTSLGIDHCPEFASKQVQVRDIKGLDLSPWDVIYCAWTCLSDEEIEELLPTLKTAKPEAIILTTSFPITDYSSDFRIEQIFPASFFWGESRIYLARRCS